VNTGRLTKIDAPMADVGARVRVVQPLAELRVPFELDIDDLDDASRGATELDLDPLIAAAERIARAEDQAIFRGWSAAGIFVSPTVSSPSSPRPPGCSGASTARWSTGPSPCPRA